MIIITEFLVRLLHEEHRRITVITELYFYYSKVMFTLLRINCICIVLIVLVFISFSHGYSAILAAKLMIKLDLT